MSSCVIFREDSYAALTETEFMQRQILVIHPLFEPIYLSWFRESTVQQITAIWALCGIHPGK